MNYYSQAGQDKWVEEILVKGEGIEEGSFIDIGCGGQLYSNTLGLEQIGWFGWLFDNSSEAQSWSKANRINPFYLMDGTKINWSVFPPDVIDYLSLDIDGASLEALRNIPLDRIKFRAITIEHDCWRFGDSLRAPQRELLTKHGYTLLRPDVICGSEPFEDWWIKKDLLKHDYH